MKVCTQEKFASAARITARSFKAALLFQNGRQHFFSRSWIRCAFQHYELALANVLAIAGVTSNFIFLGDPNQLSQPSHGIHPPGVNLAVLDHVIQDQPTMPADYGLFLETTYRLHPAVCSFVSEVFYDGKLEPDDSTRRQNLAVSNGSGGLGLRYLPVDHSGNRTLSAEASRPR